MLDNQPQQQAIRVSVSYDQTSVDIVDAEIVKNVRLVEPTPYSFQGMRVVVTGDGHHYQRPLPDPTIGREIFSQDGSIARQNPSAKRSIQIDLPWYGDASECIFQIVKGDANIPPFAERDADAPELARYRLADLIPATQDAPADALPPWPTQDLRFGSSNPRPLKLVFLAEGFTEAEIGIYSEVVNQFLEKLEATVPFKELLSSLAAIRVDSTSRASGLDDSNQKVDTCFDGHFGNGNLRRLIEVDQRKAGAAARVAARTQEGEFVGLVVVNTTEYGGSGGQVAVFSRNSTSADIALHELGHTLFNLADEYSDRGGDSLPPSEPNVTAKPDPSSANWGTKDYENIKWRRFLLPGQQLPGGINAANGVGLFEGAKYQQHGIYRPAQHCKMRTLNAEFCPVCQDVIEKKLLQFQ